MKGLKCLVLSLATLGLAAHAEYSLKINDDVTLRYGADVRARWEYWDRAVSNPDISSHAHPKNQYYRQRTRAWLALDLVDSMTINLRLVNRIQEYSSSSGNPNNRHSSTWEAPDEVIFDQANMVFRWTEKDVDFSLTVGRQQVMVGNGMIFSDSTPFDQGRTTYNDGVMLKMKSINTHGFHQEISLFSFYDTWKDRFLAIRDRNRALRQGDIFSIGAIATLYKEENHVKTFGGECIMMYNNINDTRSDYAERNFPADYSASLGTWDFRVFARPCTLLEYSLEGALQYSGNFHDVFPGSDIHYAYMVDTRLDFHLDDYLAWKPVWGLEYTCFCGGRDGHSKTAWVPVFSQCPLWGDELVPIMLNSNWSNLCCYRSSFSVSPVNDLKVTMSATEFTCDVSSTSGSTGDGDDLGLLLAGQAEYKFSKHLSFLVQLSHLNAGNYFDNGHNSFWGRFEIMVTF